MHYFTIKEFNKRLKLSGRVCSIGIKKYLALMAN